MSAPTRASTAGRAYLDLRKLARENHRPVDELLQLYVLEAFLDRLTSSRFTEQLVLKGGVLLAAFDERRPTRDIDLQAHALANDAETILTATCEIAAITLDDGVIFDTETATAESIRDEAVYGGVRVTMTAQLATARPHFHVDTNVGDPLSPAPKHVSSDGWRGAAGSGWKTDCRSSSAMSLRQPSTSPTQRFSARRKAARGTQPDAPGPESRRRRPSATLPKLSRNKRFMRSPEST